MSPLRAIARLAWSDPAAGQAAATAPIPAGVNETDWAALLTVYPSTHRHNPYLATAMLDYQDVAMSVQTADLLLSGQITITVIRSGPAGNATPGNIIQALQNVEVLMGLPLPTDNIVLQFASALPEGLELQHHGTHVVLRPGYDAAETPETSAASDSRSHRATRALAQAFAGYYWQNNAPWLDEGARRLAATISENARDPEQPVIADTMPCPQAHHLADLDNDNPAPGTPDYRCHAAFGERLFLSLYRQELYLDFLHRFRNLYRMRTDESEDQPRRPRRRDLEFAFGSNPLAAEVIAAWHDGPAPSGVRPADTSRPDLRLPGINGYLSSVLTPDDEYRFQGTFVTNRQEGPPLAEIERADLNGRPLLHITYSLSEPIAPDAEYLLELELREYYEDGFETGHRYLRMPAKIPERGKPNPNRRWLPLGPAGADQWEAGRYWAILYHQDRKVTEVTYRIKDSATETEPELTPTATPAP